MGSCMQRQTRRGTGGLFLLPARLSALPAAGLRLGAGQRPERGQDEGRGRLRSGDQSQDLIAAMEEAAAHARGEGKVARVYTLEVPDVRAIREGLELSQQALANAYRIPLATSKGWEQGRRQPDATASAYLSVIAHLPREARDVLRPD
eukprot:gene57540-76817_t